MSRKKIKQIIFLVLFIVIIIGIRFSPLAHYFTFENFQHNKDSLRQIVTDHYLLSSLLYIVFYCVSVALSLPGATILTMIGGFLFGVLPAVVYVNVGATTGAAGSFLVSRYMLGTFFQKHYGERLQKFNRKLQTHGYSYLLILRLIPAFPFFLINIVAGLTKIPLSTFIWTTALGIIPGSFLYVLAGRQLETISSTKDILSWKMIIIFLLLATAVLLPMLIKKHLKKRTL